ncbi:MAG: hypothetical protein ACFFB0_15535 [Promethearchaeota archaeon]
MPSGIFLIKWDDVLGGTIYMRYPEDLDIPDPVVQQITISHNFTESYIITEEKEWNSVSYYNENKEMIIVLVLRVRYEDGNDYLELLEEFNKELDKVTQEDKLKKRLETMFNLSLDAFRVTDQVITHLSNQVAELKTKEYDWEIKFEKVLTSNHLTVKSRILFLLTVNESLSFNDIKKLTHTSIQWLQNVLQTLAKNDVIGYNSDKDLYYLNI